jgi:hypothetical protein
LSEIPTTATVFDPERIVSIRCSIDSSCSLSDAVHATSVFSE